ncbi:MAG: hypothetical protein ACLP5H_13305 [Desulfomonilaceae bacterium]
MAKRTINAKEILAGIKAGMDDAALMKNQTASGRGKWNHEKDVLHRSVDKRLVSIQHFVTG